MTDKDLKAPWYRLPKLVAMPQLVEIRNQLRRENLHDTEEPALEKRTDTSKPDHTLLEERTVDGSYNDLEYPAMGRDVIAAGLAPVMAACSTMLVDPAWLFSHTRRSAPAWSTCRPGKTSTTMVASLSVIMLGLDQELPSLEVASAMSVCVLSQGSEVCVS